MKINDFIPYFTLIINELNKKPTNAFRIKNYKKWLELLQQNGDIYMDDITTPEQIEDIREFPVKMQEKMKEILEMKTINGIKLELNNTDTDNNNNDDIGLLKSEEEYKLIDFYGFGPATIIPYEKAGITGNILINEWNNFVSLNPENAILIWSKMKPPGNISTEIWNKMPEQNQINKLKLDLYKRLESHSKYLHLLNYHQLIGVKHYHNIKQKIPRTEMSQIEKILANIINKLNPNLILTICGSYRRGRSESGDIDCLITHPDITSKNIDDSNNILAQIVTILTNMQFLVDHLTHDGTTKYMGLCQIPNSIPRRIDIRLIPFESYYYATLYFTGSKTNNTNMRNAAKRLGYKLNEYGMYNIMDHSMCDLHCTSERDIYNFLNLPYLEPTQRDIK